MQQVKEEEVICISSDEEEEKEVEIRVRRNRHSVVTLKVSLRATVGELAELLDQAGGASHRIYWSKHSPEAIPEATKVIDLYLDGDSVLFCRRDGMEEAKLPNCERQARPFNCSRCQCKMATKQNMETHLTVCRGAGSITCGPKMPPGAAPKWRKEIQMPKNKRKEGKEVGLKEEFVERKDELTRALEALEDVENRGESRPKKLKVDKYNTGTLAPKWELECKEDESDEDYNPFPPRQKTPTKSAMEVELEEDTMEQECERYRKILLMYEEKEIDEI